MKISYENEFNATGLMYNRKIEMSIEEFINLFDSNKKRDIIIDNFPETLHKEGKTHIFLTPNQTEILLGFPEGNNTYISIDDFVDEFNRDKHSFDINGFFYNKTRYVDKDEVIAAVAENEHNFQFIPDKYRDDYDVVMSAVKENGFALYYASDRLKNDKSIVLAAIKETEASIKFASPELKADKDIAIAALTRDCRSFIYIAPELQNDTEFIINSVKNSYPDAFYYCEMLFENYNYFEEKDIYPSETINNLKNNKEYMLEVIKKCPEALQYASDELKDDPKVVLEAVQKDYNTLKYASSRIIKDIINSYKNSSLDEKLKNAQDIKNNNNKDTIKFNKEDYER